MTIAIPAIVDTQLTALRTSMQPKTDGAHQSYVVTPAVVGNRTGDLLEVLTNLIDAGPLVATGGTATQVQDTGAFTGANTLIGAKVTFTGNITPALAGVSAYVISNTTGALNFAPGALPGVPAAGDTYTVEFTTIDKDLTALRGGKSLGNSDSNPYGSGPSLINALVVLIGQLGGSVPTYLARVTDGVTKETLYDPAEAFSIGSPHGGNPSTRGTAALMLFADALLVARNTVNAYTKPT